MRRTLKPFKIVLFSLQFWHISMRSGIGGFMVLLNPIVPRCRVVMSNYEIFASSEETNLYTTLDNKGNGVDSGVAGNGDTQGRNL